MSNLGSLYYSVFLKDMTEAEFKKINDRFKNLGYDIKLTPKILKEMTQDAVPKGIKIELDPSVKNEALQKAAEGKAMKVAVTPLLTGFRDAILKATRENPPLAEIGVQETKLRSIIQNVLNKQGFMLNVSTVNDNYSKAIQQKLNGRRYTVTIHADANEITRSVQASLMQVQSRYFGLQISKDILRDSIDQALMGKPFPIQIAVMHDQARRAVQNALNNARMVGKDDALAYQRLQTGELRAAQAELARLRAAHQSAADAAKTHTSASISLGGALGSNVKIAGELGSAMASLYSVHAAKQFLSQVIEIGGELEHQKIALETIYGSESKMESLYGNIKSLARQSPFGVMELTKNVKQLSAYGVAYNEVYDTAKRLADISAATSVDIQRLILAFGKTKNRTFLDGLEAKQFAYANIPIYDALSKKLTELEGKFVSVKDVMGRIKKREIGFDMVKEILWDMTDEGGKFYNMQEKLAGSVKTSWKLVRDNIELMFGEIAESSVGDFLKRIGQTLQEVTRSWKALATVIGAGGVAFGVYKLAVAGTNVLLDKQTGSLAANYLAEKQAQAAKLRSIGLTSTLSAREKELIATRKRLTATDLEYLYVEKGLTTEEIKRLYLSGKITRAEFQKAVALGVVTQKEFEQIAGTNALNGAWLRFKATMTGTWATMKAGAASAFGMIFNWTTAAFAAIAGITYLIQHNMRENEIAEEFSKTWKQKGEDMAKELSATLSKPFENLSAPQAKELIEEYKNLIKDYATLPDDVIQRAIYDKDGNIRNTADQIKYLREELESLKKTAESMSQDMGAIVGATGDGWFKEDVVTNLKDYASAYNKANSIYLKFVNDHKETAQKMVDAASKASPAFQQEIANAKNLTEQFSILMRERAKFPEAWNAAEKAGGYWATRGGSRLGSFQFLFGNTTAMEASIKEMGAYKQAISDVQSAILGFKSLHDKWDWSNMTKEQSEEVRQFYKQLIETAEFSSPELKRTIADSFQDAFNVKIVPDKTEEEWTKNVREATQNATNESIAAMVTKLRFEGYDSLSKEQKELWEKLMKDADAKVQERLPDLFSNAQTWINQNSLTWRITFAISTLFGDTPQTAKDAIANAGGVDNLSTSTLDRVKEWQDADAKKMRDNAQKAVEGSYNLLKAAEKYGTSSQTYIEAKKKYEEDKLALKELKWDDIDLKLRNSNKHSSSKGSQKDTFAESLKQRFKDIKDAWSEFQKWSKAEGREAAATRIGESGIFSTLSSDQIPKTIEDYRTLVKGLEAELRNAGIKGNARESLLNDLLKQLLDIDKTIVDEQLKIALDKVSKEAERQIADWNLFDKIRKATGNQDFAMSIAFGMNATAETDYPAMVKKQFADLAKELGHDLTFDNTTLEEARNLGDDIAKSYQDTASKLEKYAREQKDSIADILNEYQSLSDKLVKIDADRERKIEIVDKSTMTEPQKAELKRRINVEADYQKFTQSNEYLQFFGGIYALTMQKAQQIGDLIEENLNRKLQAGAISAEDYYKEIERVRQQLDKLRNVKSNALTFMMEGFKGLNKKEQEENDSKRLETIQKIKDLEERIVKLKTGGNTDEIETAEAQLKAAKKELEIQNAIRDKLVKNQQQMENTLGVVNVVSNIAQGMSDAFNTLRDMADSFGFDTDNGAWNTAASVMDTLTTVTGGVQKMLQSLMSGDLGGVLSGVFDTLLSPITIWNQLHDKFLQKQIEKSKELVDTLQRNYEAIERRMANFLGNAKYLEVESAERGIEYLDKLNREAARSSLVSVVSEDARAKLTQRKEAYEEGGAYGYQRQMMTEQLAELEKQRQLELEKKKSDDSVVKDYEDQIDEMKIQIRDFALEVAKDLYGIDLNGWAEQLGDALVDAFAAGEDAAEAFDKKVGDIMHDVTSKMISQDILAPMFGDLRDYLFGKDGTGGAFGSDFQLDPTEMGAMKEYLDKIKNEGIPAAQELFDAINEATGGMLNDTEKSKSGMTKGLQSLTENTGDLLASYINAIRADVSLSRINWDRLLQESLPQMNVIAESQLQAQRQIAENTLRNAIAAEAILKSNENIYRLLSQATNGGARFYVN